MGYAKYQEDNARLLRERNAGRSDFCEMGWGGSLFFRTDQILPGSDIRPKRTDPEERIC